MSLLKCLPNLWTAGGTRYEWSCVLDRLLRTLSRDLRVEPTNKELGNVSLVGMLIVAVCINYPSISVRSVRYPDTLWHPVQVQCAWQVQWKHKYDTQPPSSQGVWSGGTGDDHGGDMTRWWSLWWSWWWYDSRQVTACWHILMAALLSLATLILVLSVWGNVSIVGESPREKRQTSSFISRPISMVRSSIELLADVTNYFIQVIIVC